MTQSKLVAEVHNQSLPNNREGMLRTVKKIVDPRQLATTVVLRVELFELHTTTDRVQRLVEKNPTF